MKAWILPPAAALLLGFCAARFQPCFSKGRDTATKPGIPKQHARPMSWKDGVYEGTSPGWTGMKVQVRVHKGKIHSVKVLEVKGTLRFAQMAVDSLPARMRINNSTEVDGVSGASLSSNSLKDAVQAALENAKP